MSLLTGVLPMGKGRKNESSGNGFNPSFAGIFTLMRRERRAPGPCGGVGGWTIWFAVNQNHRAGRMGWQGRGPATLWLANFRCPGGGGEANSGMRKEE
jgi:hypothetical protein